MESNWRAQAVDSGYDELGVELLARLIDPVYPSHPFLIKASAPMYNAMMQPLLLSDNSLSSHLVGVTMEGNFPWGYAVEPD